MKRRAVVALLLATALGALTAPAAGAKLPVGEADGVRIIRVKGAIVVVFTPQAAKLLRHVTGEQVSVYCTEVVETRDTTPAARPGGHPRHRPGPSEPATSPGVSTTAACRFRRARSAVVMGWSAVAGG